MRKPSGTRPAAEGGRGRSRVRLALVVGVSLVVLWLAAGLRQIDRNESYGVLDGILPGPFPMKVEAGWALAPPGFLRLHRYPVRAVEVDLPGAREASIPGTGGTRFGFEGWVTVRAIPDEWRALHEAARRHGLRGAVTVAVREAGRGIDAGIHVDLGAQSFRQELSERLERSLSVAGLELRRLEVTGLDYLTIEAGERVEDTGARLLVIGLDGADWEILDPLLEQGRLPNLKRLVDGGVRAKLLTISPMLSPVIWTTVATGVEPDRHGILDFLVSDPAGEGREPVTSRQRKVPTVWEILGRSGVDVGVVAWWASWPADEVSGYLVSDRLAYQLFEYEADPDDPEGKTWPPRLYDRIRPLQVPPDAVPWERVVSFLSGPRTGPGEFDAEETELLEGFRTLLASGDSYVAITEALRREFRPRFEAVYLEGTDTVGHLFMRYRPPRLPGVEDARFESFREMVDRYYELADEYVGRLLEGTGDETTVMILSDHGFASDATRPRSADSRIGHGQAASWHRRFGVLVLSGANMRSGTRIEEASVYDVAPTVLALFGQPVPQTWPGRVLAEAFDETFFERFPVRFRLDDPARDPSVTAAATGTQGGASQDVIDRLEALGYLAPEEEGEGSGGEDTLTYRNNRGVALMAEGRYAEAEAMFRAGLEDEPDHPMLLVNLGVVLRRSGRTEESREVFLRALEHPNSLRAAAHFLAQDALAEGALAEGERYLQMALDREPDAAELLNTLGLVRQRQGREDDAAELWLRAAELDPNTAQPRVNLGNRALRRGDVADAETWYTQAIEADPFFMGAYNNLAMIYQDRGERDRAIDLYARALEKAPNNAVVLNNLASLYYARGDVDEATSHWRRCVRIAPDYPSPYNNLAGVALSRQNWDEAERLIRKALALDGNYGDARINLAHVEVARNRPEQARGEFIRATEDPRARTRALVELGRLELAMGEPASAVERLEAARRNPGGTVPAVLNLLGEAYARVGRVADAVAAWEASLEVNPDQDDVRRRIEESAAD